MKKIIALALALVMALSMASVAFAGDCAMDVKDCEVELPGDVTTHLLPGETYALDDALITLTDDSDEYADILTNAQAEDPKATAKDVKVTTDWTKGGALVASIYWDKDEGDDGAWMMELKENFTITDPKQLKGEITFEGKGKTKDMEDVVLKIDTFVSNHLVTVYGEEDADDADEIEAENNTLYKCEEDEDGFVKFNKGALLGCTLNMASEEKAFMYSDEEANEALEEKFPEAEIECYNFGGSPKFKNDAEFTLQADYADQYYIYTWDGRKLAALEDAKWDSIEGVYTWKTKTPKSYVISDVELVAAAEDGKNPDTGANDVVGVAAALAVVSLAAGAAVALKK